jgi:hypothetical protein
MKRLGHLSRDARIARCVLKAATRRGFLGYLWAISETPTGHVSTPTSARCPSALAVAGAHRNGISSPKNKGFCNPVACNTEPVVVVMIRGGRILPTVSIELREGEVAGTI